MPMDFRVLPLLFVSTYPAYAFSSESSESAVGNAGPNTESVDNLHARMREKCPHAVEAHNAQIDALEKRQPDISHVSRPALQRELLLMVERDQSARQAWNINNNDQNSPEIIAAKRVDADNLRRFKQIIRWDGFPNAKMVGYNGVAAAWLLLQHADSDPNFQHQWLPVVKVLASHGDLSFEQYALLVDRVRLAQGKPQLYGSQLTMTDGVLNPLPVEDSQGLDRRRLALGMSVEDDYLCLSRVSTGPAPAAKANKQ